MYFPRTLNRALITWFGCGLAPFAPGTIGSIGALPVCWALAANTSPLFRLIVAIGFTALACLASAQDQAEGTAKDPSYVVIDEVAGMLWATLMISAEWKPMLIAFVLFRVFDILKPPPALFFDRWSKISPSAVRRGAHIVLDDVFAGLFACGSLWLASLLLPHLVTSSSG